MDKISLVFICMFLGICARRLRLFPQNAAATLNRFVICISLPAFTLYYIHGMDPTQLVGGLAFLPVVAAWSVFLMAILFFWLIGRLLGWDNSRVGALTLVTGLGNTSFVGFAMIESLYGPAGLPPAILFDQVGTFLAMSTLGVIIAVLYSGAKLSRGKILAKLFTFPPLLALILAFCLRSMAFPEGLSWGLERLGSTLVPLALFAVGLELNVSGKSLRREASPLGVGLGYKLLLAPLMVFAIAAYLFSAHGLVLKVTVIEAATAPMVTAGILAVEYGLEPELVPLLIGVGIPMSLVTILLWNWVLGFWV